jgi:hypothetical protein
MNVPRNDDRLDGLLFEVFAAETPRPDFSKWEQKHPEAVDALKAACRPAEIGSVNPLPLRIGAWIVSNRYAKATVMVAALAVVAVFVSWLCGDGVGPAPNAPSDQQPLRRPAEEIAWNQIDTTPILTESSGRTVQLRREPLSIRVARASAIVRAEMTALTESQQLVCKVTRVIYGRVPGDVLHVEGLRDADVVRTRARLRAKLGRRPTDAEVAAEIPKTTVFEAGRKVILFLDQGRKPDEPLVWRYQGMTFDAPPRHPLEKTEKEIVETIRSGSYLSPDLNPADLGPYLRACESVVRATLTKVGKTSALWKVEAVLHIGSPSRGGERDPEQQPPPATITVGLDTWRLRAESIANYRAAQQGEPSATPEEVKREYNRLVASELRTGRQGILFIRSQENAGKKSAFKLIGILQDDPGNGKPIDQTDAKIRQEIKKGDWRAIYL